MSFTTLPIQVHQYILQYIDSYDTILAYSHTCQLLYHSTFLHHVQSITLTSVSLTCKKHIQHIHRISNHLRSLTLYNCTIDSTILLELLHGMNTLDQLHIVRCELYFMIHYIPIYCFIHTIYTYFSSIQHFSYITHNQVQVHQQIMS